MSEPKIEQRIIIEMGMGNDLHGMDYTKAGRARSKTRFAIRPCRCLAR